MQPPVQVKNLPESNHPQPKLYHSKGKNDTAQVSEVKTSILYTAQVAKGKEKVHIGKPDFFQLLAHARALGHGATSGIWQIIA